MFEGLFQDAIEAIFGHVATREEKMAEIKQKLQGVVDQADEDLCYLEIGLEDCEAERKRAARKGDQAALQRAARKTVRRERERERLERRREAVELQLQQTKEQEGDQVMLDSRLQMLALAVQATPLPNKQQLQQTLYQYQYNMDYAKQVSDMMREATEDAQGSLEEAELDSEGEERVEALVREQLDLENQKKFALLPKPVGARINSAALSAESTAEQMLANREEARRLEQFLAEHK